MKKQEQERITVTGPITVRVSSRLNQVKTEGLFQDKIDKAKRILKKSGLPKKSKAHSE